MEILPFLLVTSCVALSVNKRQLNQTFCVFFLTNRATLVSTQQYDQTARRS